MQPHQYALAAGIALLCTLSVLPWLFAVAKRRAFDQGKEIGLEIRNATHNQQVRELNYELDEIAIQREAEQRKHHHTTANLKRTITELEERIMSYTGLAVTRADYDLLISTAESLELAEKTWKALPGTEPGRKRAAQQQQDIQALAMRVHFQLRSTPATAAKMEVAA